jgi:hypothetical protein
MKLNDNGNMFILNDSNRIMILFDVQEDYFANQIEMTVPPGDGICDFKCLGQDKILVLHTNNKISLYRFNNVSSLLLDEKDLNNGFNQLDYQSISLATCPQSKNYACLLKGSGGRPDKIISGEI